MNKQLLLSTDTLQGYGLDLIFQTAKQLWFAGIDLAVWKNFDSRNVNYVNMLQEKYQLPVWVIQISSDITEKELEHAVKLSQELNTTNIAINAPQIFNYKAYYHLNAHIKKYKEEYPELIFTIINPSKETLFLLPIPKYRFTNMVDIIKNYECHLWLDLAHLDLDTLDREIHEQLPKLMEYISTIYLADKSKAHETSHLPLGDGTVDLPKIMDTVKKTSYTGYFSLKIQIPHDELAETSKLERILERNVEYFRKHYLMSEE